MTYYFGEHDVPTQKEVTPHMVEQMSRWIRVFPDDVVSEARLVIPFDRIPKALADVLLVDPLRNKRTDDGEEIKVVIAILKEWFSDAEDDLEDFDDDLEDCAGNIVEALRNLSEPDDVPPFVDRHIHHEEPLVHGDSGPEPSP